MQPRVLVLTAGFGEGHNAAARALVRAFDAASGEGAARMVDVFSQATPRVDAISRKLYIDVINRAPRLWNRFYRWLDRADLFPRHLWLVRAGTRELAATLARERPVALCATYPIYAFMLNRLLHREAARPRWFNVVTDSISINSLWWKSPCAGWFVPNPDSAEVLRAAGIPGERVHVAGFPVGPFFAENEFQLAPPDLAAGAAPRVLVIINSGTRNAEATARALMAEPEWELSFAVGRDQALKARLEALAAGRKARVEVLGWTDQIPRLLMTSHAVVSKAGGATTQEAIAARCPMIVSQVVPGQEEGNYELLRRRGAGALATTPEAIRDALRSAFAHQGKVWRRWRAALAVLARPEAARAIAAHVLAAAGPEITTDATLRAR